MKYRRISLVVIGIGLILAGRYVSAWRPDPIVAAIETPEGFGIVATVDREGRSKVRRSSASKVNQMDLAFAATRVVDLKLDTANKRLFVLSETQLICANYLTGEELWNRYHRLAHDRVQLLSSPSKETIVLIGPRAFAYSGNAGVDIRALNASDGATLQTAFRKTDQVTVRDSGMTIRSDDGRWLSLSFEADSVEDSLAKQTWTPTVCAEYASDSSLTREWVTDRRDASHSGAQERPFYNSSGVVIALSLAMIVPMVFWTRELVTDGLNWNRSYRPFLNLTLIFCLLFLLGMPMGSRVLKVDPNPLQQQLTVFLLLAAAQAMLFALLTRISQPRHLWIAILAACSFPPMLLVVLLARVVRSPQAVVQEKSKFRFGIAEMLLSTTGIAILLAIGVQSLWMVGAGFGIALHILISFLFTRTREWSWGTLVVSLAVVTLASTLQSFTNLSPMFYLFAVPLGFSVIGI
ncbi:MAG: hypothetical protein AAFU85_31755, partial [Planctomycetota bacterium]